MKKYEIVKEMPKTQQRENGETYTYAYRIRALKDFSDIKKGDLGGFAEDENCLSHDGDSWLYDDATVYGGGRVSENAKLYDTSCVLGQAKVTGNTKMYGHSHAFGKLVKINGNSVLKNTHVTGLTEKFNQVSISLSDVELEKKIVDEDGIRDGSW